MSKRLHHQISTLTSVSELVHFWKKQIGNFSFFWFDLEKNGPQLKIIYCWHLSEIGGYFHWLLFFYFSTLKQTRWRCNLTFVLISSCKCPVFVFLEIKLGACHAKLWQLGNLFFAEERIQNGSLFTLAMNRFQISTTMVRKAFLEKSHLFFFCQKNTFLQ